MIVRKINMVNVDDREQRQDQKKYRFPLRAHFEDSKESNFLFLGGPAGLDAIVKQNTSNIVYMLGELIDNSIQHRKTDGSLLRIDIQFDMTKNDENIIFQDNAIGLQNLYKTFTSGKGEEFEYSLNLSRFGTGLKAAISWFSDFTQIQTRSKSMVSKEYAAEMIFEWKELRKNVRKELSNDVMSAEAVKMIDIIDTKDIVNHASTFTYIKMMKSYNGEVGSWKLANDFDINSMKALVLKLRERYSELIQKDDIVINFYFIQNQLNPEIKPYDPNHYEERLSKLDPDFTNSGKSKELYYTKNIDFNFTSLDKSNCVKYVDDEKTFNIDFISSVDGIITKSKTLKIKDEFFDDSFDGDETRPSRKKIAAAIYKKILNEIKRRIFDSNVAKDLKSYKPTIDFLQKPYKDQIKELGVYIDDESLTQFYESDESKIAKQIYGNIDSVERKGSKNLNLKLVIYFVWLVKKNIANTGKLILPIQFKLQPIKDLIDRNIKDYRIKEKPQTSDLITNVRFGIYSIKYSTWATNNIGNDELDFENSSGNTLNSIKLHTGFSLVQNERSIIHGFNPVSKTASDKAKDQTNEDVTSLVSGYYTSVLNDAFNQKLLFDSLSVSNKNNIMTWRSMGSGSGPTSRIFGSVYLTSFIQDTGQNKAGINSVEMQELYKKIELTLQYSLFGILIDLVTEIDDFDGKKIGPHMNLDFLYEIEDGTSGIEGGGKIIETPEWPQTADELVIASLDEKTPKNGKLSLAQISRSSTENSEAINSELNGDSTPGEKKHIVTVYTETIEKMRDIKFRIIEIDNPKQNFHFKDRGNNVVDFYLDKEFLNTITTSNHQNLKSIPSIYKVMTDVILPLMYSYYENFDSPTFEKMAIITAKIFVS